MKKLLSILACAAFFAPILVLDGARADYPNKAVQFIVPWPPGDIEDVLTRMIADDFQKEYGQPAAVVNKPGGAGGPFPGAVEVAKAPADGYTIGSFVIGVPIAGPQIGIPELNPNPFEPVGIFLTYPFVIVTAKDKPYKSMAELAEYAKTEKVVLGHFGAPLPPTRVTLALAKKMGFSYGSDAAFDKLDCNSIASGDIDVMNTTIPLILPCLDDVTVLATVTEERIELVPNAPTVGELEPDLKLALWNGLFVRKDVPADVREKIAAVARKTVKSEKAEAFAKKTAAQIYWKDAKASAERIAADTETFKRLSEVLE